jgi:TIR domain
VPELADKAEVFISYSRCARGARPPAGDPDAVRRWRARAIVLGLLDLLAGAAERAGYQVWRDEPAMSAGDLLAHSIDAALLSCAGAVILLDPDGLDQSVWVRWESAILAWRRRIGMPVRLVPVFVGVAPADLAGHGYGPSELDRTLAHVIDPDVTDPDAASFARDLEGHAADIIKALGELEGEPVGPVSWWVSRIADCLPANDESWRPSVQPELPRGERLRLSAQPGRVVARELLVAERNRFQRIVNAFYGFPFRSAVTLKLNLEPVWVPADAVTGLAEVAGRPPGERIIAVNAVEPSTGSAVVRRAFPGASPYQRLEWVNTGVTAAAAVAEAEAAIAWKWPDPDHEAEIMTGRGGCFVIVSCGSTPPADLAWIVGELAVAYPGLTYVVMVGDAAAGPYQRLDPALPAGSDEAARAFGAMLDDMLVLDRR